MLVALLAENVETLLKSLPEVTMERAVDLLQTIFVGGVYRDVKLGYVTECCKLGRVLGIADEEG